MRKTPVAPTTITTTKTTAATVGSSSNSNNGNKCTFDPSLTTGSELMSCRSGFCPPRISPSEKGLLRRPRGRRPGRRWSRRRPAATLDRVELAVSATIRRPDFTLLTKLGNVLDGRSLRKESPLDLVAATKQMRRRKGAARTIFGRAGDCLDSALTFPRRGHPPRLKSEFSSGIVKDTDCDH